MSGLDAVALAGRLGKGQVTSSEVCETLLDRIGERDPGLNAFLSTNREGALSEARAVDRARKAGEALPAWAGLPVAVKDNLTTRDQVTTCGSRMLEGYRPPYDATAVRHLRAGRLPILGKTNLDEFAMGSSTENSAFGPTRNPVDVSRVPGGSSGGSAAAVAAGLAPWALGSDTGGSVRQPAAYCGIVGMKPTYGRVSRFGLVAFASSLDQVGMLTRSVRDSAALLGLVAGQDANDATSAPAPPEDFLAAAEEGRRRGGDALKGLRIGRVEEAFGEGVDPAVAASVDDALRALEGAGATVVPVHLPSLPYALSAYYLLATAEASSNLARFDGVRYGLRVEAPDVRRMFGRTRAAGFGREVERRIVLGTFVLSHGYYEAYYVRAQKVRSVIRKDLMRALAEADVLVTPTAPDVPFRLGERTADPLRMYAADLLTVPVSLAGFPALSVPSDRVGGLPVGVQWIGRPFDETRLLRMAAAYETLAPWPLADLGGWGE